MEIFLRHILNVKTAFNDCLQRHGKSKLSVVRTITKDERKRKRKIMVDTLRKSGKITSKLQANVVNELLQAIC